MKLVLHVLFCSWTLSRASKYCGRWNTIVMTMAYGKDLVLTVLCFIQNLLKNVANVIPHYARSLQLYSLGIWCMHLHSISTSRVPTHGYWLDTYYCTYTMPGSVRICTWAMVPLQQTEATGRGQRQDVIGFYFSLSSWMLNRTLSRMCSRWYLPVFLLCDGSLTSMKMASVTVLVRFWAFHPNIYWVYKHLCSDLWC